jgi:hypothetical protein
MELKTLLLTAAIAVIGVGANAADKMYKWKDDKGILHYTETPPAGDVAYEIIEVKNQFSNDNYRPQRRNTSQQQAQPAEEKPGVPQSEVEKYKAARQHNCQVAKKNLYTLQNVARVRITDESGKERLLTDEEKQERIALSKEQVKTFCGPDTNGPEAKARSADNSMQ